MTRRQPRRAGADKIRRRTGGKLDLARSIEDQRLAFAGLLALTQVGMPEHACASQTVAGIECLVLLPEAGPAARELVFVHGGGYAWGSPRTHRPLAARIGRAAGARVLLPTYRRAPEHPCPAGIEDVLAVWSALPVDRRRSSVLVGDSAGGGLALAMAMLLRDRGEPLPAGLVLLSPWTDLTVSGDSIDALAHHEVMLGRAGLEFMARQYAGALDPRDPRVSPLFGAFEGLPPMLIQVGAHEVLLDDARRVAQRAQEAGVDLEIEVWPGQQHVFQATPMVAAAADAIAKIGEWVVRRAP